MHLKQNSIIKLKPFKVATPIHFIHKYWTILYFILNISRSRARYICKFPEGPVENPADTLQLKRELGWFSASNFIVSTMIGSGIFVSSSSALLYSGSVGLTLIIWLVAGLICFLGKLTIYIIFNEHFPSLKTACTGYPFFRCFHRVSWLLLKLMRFLRLCFTLFLR